MDDDVKKHLVLQEDAENTVYGACEQRGRYKENGNRNKTYI